jgi:hypothetical protein
MQAPCGPFIESSRSSILLRVPIIPYSGLSERCRAFIGLVLVLWRVHYLHAIFIDAFVISSGGTLGRCFHKHPAVHNDPDPDSEIHLLSRRRTKESSDIT